MPKNTEFNSKYRTLMSGGSKETLHHISAKLVPILGKGNWDLRVVPNGTVPTLFHLELIGTPVQHRVAEAFLAGYRLSRHE